MTTTIVSDAVGWPGRAHPTSAGSVSMFVVSDDFDAFVRAITPALLRSAYLLTGDQHLAEDLVQSALARAHRHWPNLQSTGNADAYVRKIMYHLNISMWRRRRVVESPRWDVPEPRANHGDEAGRAVTRLTLRRALLRLPARQRAVVVLRYLEDRSEAETADLLGVSVGTVKSQASKALARLRDDVPELVDLHTPGDHR